MKARFLDFVLRAMWIATAALVPGLAHALDNDAFITLRGLVALGPSAEGPGIRAHFLSPDQHPHPAALSILVSELAVDQDEDKFRPDRLIPLGGGDALAIWDFKTVELDTTNVKDTDYYEDTTAVSGEATDPNDNRAGWAPTMQSIFKVPRQIKKTFKAPATATFTVGRLEAIFDGGDHRRELWTIGERTCTAVADAYRLAIDLEDDAAGFLLIVNTAKKRNQEIHLKKGANPILSALPLPLHMTTSLQHFVHFYGMRKKTRRKEPNPADPSICGVPPPPPSFNGSRCAPTKFP